MNREIKFRAWNSQQNLMVEDANWLVDKKIDAAILMQLTGLKDKNGKEIYEGDIVKLEDIICPITWEDGGFQMITIKSQGKSYAVQDRLKYFEVIGNIYENPNLL
jgi:uncharacterized phage protein (TIGR01671 family)